MTRSRLRSSPPSATDHDEEMELLASLDGRHEVTDEELEGLIRGPLPDSDLVVAQPGGSLPDTASGKSRRRAIKFRAGGRSEAHLLSFAVERSRAGRPKKTRSEKSRARWRSDKARDEEIFKFINACLRGGQPVRVTASGAHTVKAARRLLADARLSGAAVIPSVGLPHWDHADPHLKMIGWGLAAHVLGATPFTLRLSSSVTEGARADRRGIGRYLQDRLARHLRERMPGRDSLFWFAVEAGPLEEPHIHGAIVFAAHDEAAAMAALRAAGGTWRSRARQLKWGVRRQPIGWVSYSTKWLYGSRLRLRDENTVAASNLIRRAAREEYLDVRRTRRILYP